MAASDRIVPQELPTAPSGRHYHLCDQGCLTHIVCAAGPECNIDPWTCPNCELDRRAAWLERNEVAELATRIDAERMSQR